MGQSKDVTSDISRAIPRIIHQTWKTAEPPQPFRELQQSWRGRNPAFAYRFWTDADIDRFVASDYPELLPLYRGYRDPIARIDLARYLILKRFGGVYADLDCECLRPIDGLLDGRSFVIGLEPPAHGTLPKAVERGLPDILCPSFIASVPGHPFWDHVLDRMAAARDCPDVLDATGPFLLTRTARSYAGPAEVTVEPAERLYPVTKEDCWTGRVFDPVFWERATRDAYALHYWEGTWFRPAGESSPRHPQHIPVRTTGGAGAPPAASQGGGDGTLPLISCLMVTRGRVGLARFAIDSFLRQTYPNRELVILDDGPEDGLARLVAGLRRPEIRLIRLPDQRLPLGRLRNMAVEQAAGEYVCQWDDDDLYDPQRLEYQYLVLKHAGAHACLLSRWMIWWPTGDRLAVSCEREWEGSLLCEKAVMPRYPHLRRGEDTPVVEQLLRSLRVVRMDLPRLYTYVVHGNNTFDAAHFETNWRAASVRYTGERYRALLEELGKRLPLDAYRRAAAQAATPAPSSSAGASCGSRVRVFGHLTAATGLGAAARGTVTALRAAGLSVEATDLPLDETHPHPFAPPPLPEGAGDAGFPATIVHTNPDALLQALNAPESPLDAGSLAGRPVIGYWAWEAADGIPDAWRAALPLIDEIWVPSSYTAAAVAAHVPVPVIPMPHPVSPPQPGPDRQALGIPEDRFCFLFMFDATSNVTRKNPAGLIQAYRAAFPEGTEGTLLIVKAKKLDPAGLAGLERLAAGRADIRIVNEPCSAEQAAGLIAACDAYVSLHRAEGFGLTMAEAMACGKPVIATGYSGNMDFMVPGTGYAVPYRLGMLDRDDGYYRRGTVWAEPDLGQAALLMRHVATHREEARATGDRAAHWVRSRLSPAAVGERMRNRLAVLAAGRHAENGRTAAPPLLPASPAPASAAAPDRTVLVLTPVKDARPHLPRYLELLDGLAHDPSRLSLAFLESDSRDGTYEFLADRLPALRGRYRRVELLKQDYGFRPEEERWAPAIQRRRREILARSRNRLLAALRDEAWVLWLDADLIHYPPDLLARLLAAGRDIVVPHCLRPDGQTFDLNSFRFAGDRQAAEHPRHLIDGIFQPPRGEGRIYLGSFAGPGPVPLDGVGGTALLVRADLHREGLTFPPYPYRGYIETEGLAMMARDMGAECWGLPDLHIVHAAS